jgi:hypothetical protein
MDDRINNLKYYTAKIIGYEVEIFPASIPEVVHISIQSILDISKKKDDRASWRLKILVERSCKKLMNHILLKGGENLRK